MKYVIFLMMLLVLAACGSPITRAIEMPGVSHVQMAQILKSRAVALVEKDSTGGVEAFCSGVWVSSTEILTAQHCVADEVGADFVVNSDIFDPNDPNLPREKVKSHYAIVVKRDLDHDLALLGAYSGFVPSHDVAPVFPGEVVQGQMVLTMGQPNGLWFSFSSGEVAAVRVMPNAKGFEMLLIQSTAPISPGSSGGGLYDENGMIVGITHGAFTGNVENLNLFIHTKYIRKLLNK